MNEQMKEKERKKKKRKTYMHINFLLLVQRNKLNIRTGTSIIQEGAFNGIKIMSTNGNKGPPSANVVVELVLFDFVKSKKCDVFFFFFFFCSLFLFSFPPPFFLPEDQ